MAAAEPAGLVAEIVDIAATIIKAIDNKKLGVTLKLPGGSMATTKVDKSVKASDTLKVGHSLHVPYTEVIVISVEKP